MDPEIKAAVEGVTQAFVEFRAANDARIKALEDSADAAALKLAAAEMGGGGPSYVAAGQKAIDPTASPAEQTRASIRAQLAQRRPAGSPPEQEVGIADVFRAVAGMKAPAPVLASLAGGTDSSGGYALPSTTTGRILDALTEQSALMQAGMGVELLDQGAKSLTVAGIDALPTPAWRAELGNVAESDPTFRAGIVVPRSLAVIVRISRELLADAPDMDRAIRAAVTAAFAAEIDRACLIGSGTAPEPRGLANIAGLGSVAQAGSAFSFGDVLGAYEKLLLAKSAAPTALIVAPRTAIDLAGMVDTTGQPLRKPDILAPVPVLVASQLPTDLGTGTDESIGFLGDFRTCKLYMREVLSVALLREAYAKTGEIGFLVHARADFAALYPQAICKITGVK